MSDKILRVIFIYFRRIVNDVVFITNFKKMHKCKTINSGYKDVNTNNTF